MTRPRAAALVLGFLVTLSLLGTPALSASAAGCPRPGGVAVPPAPSPKNADIVFKGHGWGHGMGMSQYGAQGAARLGCSYTTILKTYYRNTSLRTQAMSAPVRLSLLSNAGHATLRVEVGTAKWTGGVKQPAGTTWKVVRRAGAGGAGGVAVLDATGTQRAWVGDGRALTASHSGSVVRIRSYLRGASWPSSDLRTRWDQARFVGTGSRIAVTQRIVASGSTTAVQKYLQGLAEVPLSWPQHALRAQVVAARTYLAAKYSSSAGAYLIQTTTADQVYRGYRQESQDTAGRWRSAVAATKGEVLVDRSGRVITAMYSSSMGGHTEDRQYVYGSYGISYLKAVDDSRWDRASDNRYRSWAVGMSRAQVAKKLGFTSISKISIPQRGSSARVSGLRVTGVRAGKEVSVTFTGAAARAKLGLRSPGFAVLVRK
jgi:stage II sporulation protein D